MKYFVGDIVKMRKTHPCGGTEWEVLRVGMDFRIKCLGCGRVVMLSRPKFEKAVKNIVKSISETAFTPESEISSGSGSKSKVGDH
ncbi:MAG TPA: DUF951 domain-containing protein [Bacillota bacterium]|nr:DUF951 domain-containing protein [Bacillota bacterium]